MSLRDVWPLGGKKNEGVEGLKGREEGCGWGIPKESFPRPDQRWEFPRAHPLGAREGTKSTVPLWPL